MRMKPQLRKVCKLKRKWRFMRVMPTSILHENLQGIPGEFASKFSSELSTMALLTVANQHMTWTVKISKTKNKLRLGTGWEKFVGDNSINDACMMVFKHKGNCDFNIHVFDPSGFEIQCSPVMMTTHPRKKKTGTSCVIVTEEEKDEEEEDIDEHKKYLLRPHSRTKQATRRRSSPRGEEMDISPGSSKENVTYEEEEEGSIRHEDFLLSVKNPFFCAKIRPGSRPSDLLVPSDFIQTFSLKFDEIILLEDPKRRKFEARVVIWKDGRTWLTQGWKRFYKYNMVSDKDTCYCEFIPTKGPTCHVIKVHIFREQK